MLLSHAGINLQGRHAMPTSYQSPMRQDRADTKTRSQSVGTNLKTETATVGRILDSKGRNTITIRAQETLGKAVEILRDNRIGALLVTDAAGTLQGILSERDIVRKLADAPGRTLPHSVADVMTSEVETCTSEETAVSVLQRMTQGKFRHMPVVDGGVLVGMVTIGDVVQFRLTEVEHEALQLKQLIVG
jgi:CBS domain-containing protein